MKTDRLLKILAVVAIVFGALTVFSGGRTLFGSAEARASVGDSVASRKRWSARRLNEKVALPSAGVAGMFSKTVLASNDAEQ